MKMLVKNHKQKLWMNIFKIEFSYLNEMMILNDLKKMHFPQS